jgi:hypothetical protein
MKDQVCVFLAKESCELLAASFKTLLAATSLQLAANSLQLYFL